MLNVLTVVLLIPGALLALFAGYQLLFMVLSLPALVRRRTPLGPDAGTPASRFIVAVPAHNERLLIAQTVRALLASDYPLDKLKVIVIADNCSDETASIARAEGATVLERRDLEKPGKPHALNWLVSQLDTTTFDGLCIIDADTAVDREFLRRMDLRLRSGEQALQGYFGVMNPDENWLTRLGVLPSVLKFRLHFPGKQLLRLSCPLAGNGMCFSNDVIRRMGWQAFSLTENWEYYVMLVLAGYLPTAATEARIYSQLARSLRQGETQRVRWMRGRIDTLLRYGTALLTTLSDRPLVKLDVLMELARPSHSMLLFWSLVYLAVSVGAWLISPEAGRPLALLAMAILTAQVVYFMAGLAVQKPPLRTWVALVMVPWYLLWKAVVSTRGIANLSDRRWTKTTRHSTE